MTANRPVAAELTEPWSEPIYGVAPVRPSAPRVMQGFSAVPLPSAIVEKKTGSNTAWIVAAAVIGLVVFGTAIGFGVQVALRSEPAPVAPTRTRVRPTPAPPPAAVQAPAATKVARSAAPAKTSRSKVAAKPAKQKLAEKPKPAAVSAKPEAQQRSPRFADEPSDPD